MLIPHSLCRCLARTKHTAKDPKYTKPAPRKLFEILMLGERETTDLDAKWEDLESRFSFEDHTSMSSDEEDTETEAESFDEDDEIGSDHEKEEGESSVGNIVKRISTEIALPEVDLISDLKVTPTKLQHDTGP